MKRTAFSLVELSIVLVILGLLTGGILAGKSLIRAAEVRSVGTQITKTVTAFYAFRDKYFYLPGDLPNATSIWGALDPTANVCGPMAATGLATCNGNGDGMLDVQSNITEWFRVWQHLANAGLIEGQYTGVNGGAASLDATPDNSPMTKLSNVGISTRWIGAIDSTHTSHYEAYYGNPLYVGTKVGNQQYRNIFLKAEEQWNLDTKMDDGLPAYGKLMGFKNDLQCITSSTPASAAYKLTDTSQGCAIVYRAGF